MKILIVSQVPTHPITEGNRKFIFNQVELFKQLGHDVFYLWIYEQPISDFSNCIHGYKDMKEYWKDNLFVLKISRMEHAYHQILAKVRIYLNNGYNKADDHYFKNLHKTINKLNKHHCFDCCVMNYYNLSKAAKYINIPLVGLTTHDYFSFKSLLVGNKAVALNTTPSEEAKALQRISHIFALNSEEAVYFHKLSPLSKVYNVYSCYDFVETPYVGNHNLLFFSGSNVYNLSGLKWFLCEIFPDIVNAFPDARLVVGGSISNKVKQYKNENVEIYGYVDDLNDFFNKGDILINPTYLGTGLKIKTFEGISYGKVVMAHPHSAVGIYKPENAPLFVSESAHEWVAFLSEIWKNISLIEAIKQRDKNYIECMDKFVKDEYLRFFSHLS